MNDRHTAFLALLEEFSNPKSPFFLDAERLERERVKLHQQEETTSD